MPAILIQVTPNKSATIYAAAAALHKRGPMSRADLFSFMDFGPENNRENKLQQAFDTNWLQEADGKIGLTDYSQRHFDCANPRGTQVGEPTAPAYRGNVFGKPLDPKRIPNRHGLRPANDAAPAWSRRESVSIKTIGGGEA